MNAQDGSMTPIAGSLAEKKGRLCQGCGHLLSERSVIRITAIVFAKARYVSDVGMPSRRHTALRVCGFGMDWLKGSMESTIPWSGNGRPARTHLMVRNAISQCIALCAIW